MFTYFAENLSSKLCTKFQQNRPSFIEDITKKHFGLFFPDTVYNQHTISNAVDRQNYKANTERASIVLH